MINLKSVDFDKLEKLNRQLIPGTETKKRLSGYFGYFEAREGYNKLVAYGPFIIGANVNEGTLQITWIHKEYLKK
jgi:hypothetical protein